MRKMSSVIFLSFFITFMLVTPVIGSSDWVDVKIPTATTNIPDEKVWVENTKTKQGDVFYYKKGNVEKSKSKYIVQVWEKQVYSDEGRWKCIQMGRNSRLSTEGWEKLSYSINLTETDCKKRLKRLLHVTLYDVDGNILYSHSTDKNKQKWNYIVPDSVNENLQNKVCK